MNPEGLMYSKDHEWIGITGDTGTVGITLHAQEASDVGTSNFPAWETNSMPTNRLANRVRKAVSGAHAHVGEVSKSIDNQRQAGNPEPVRTVAGS
jgi:glycine cleavage system H lipoate-binding protein